MKMRYITMTMVMAFMTTNSFAYTLGNLLSGHTKEKIIALTFDDGPGPFTRRFLAF